MSQTIGEVTATDACGEFVVNVCTYAGPGMKKRIQITTRGEYFTLSLDEARMLEAVLSEGAK